MTGREAALTVLTRCRRDEAWASAALDGLSRSEELDRREAALASALSLGVLQNESLLDYYIGCFCHRKLEPKLRDLMRLGAYQILFMDKIPDRAAVNESVLLSRKNGYSRASGLVNAVLRRLAEKKNALPQIPGEGTAEGLSIRYSHPRWLVETLLDQEGLAFTEAFLSGNNAPCPLEIQVNTLRCCTEDFCRALNWQGIAWKQPGFPADHVTLESGRIAELPGYEEGLFYVQDRAARMAVEITAPQPGMRVLDACAAPGGKSFAAALLMEDRGHILARDLHANKLARIQSGAVRLGLGCIKTAAADARIDDPELHGRFDLVLADVPCSGTGVIRKRPEIRKKQKEDVERLPELQLEILRILSSYVRPGGTLLYSTCSVLRAENDGVVAAFLSAHPEFSPQDFTVGQRPSKSGCYTFWPQIDGTDGFFAAKMKRAEI